MTRLFGIFHAGEACYVVLRFVIKSGPKGCEWKAEGIRAKAMKFIDGYMISSGQPVNECIDSAVRHVLLRKGVLGIKVKTMLDWDPDAKPDLLSFLCVSSYLSVTLL
ncbi:PREDICTED: 40S ribosomal protein S3-1-like [Fragaria vesca subsp. vesca]